MFILFVFQVHMDPHNDVRSDVDYQAVLSHMNIHKGKVMIEVFCLPIDFGSNR